MSVSRADARVGRKDSVELSVDEVEAVIAALGDKVARLQKDIATLKRTHRFNYSLANPDGSHRPTDMPNELTTRKVLRKRISRGIQYDTQDCQQINYRVSVKCFQNSEINHGSIKHRQNHRSNNVSKAQGNEARSINKQRDKSVIWNMDEQTGKEVVVVASRREIDNEKSRAEQVDAGRYATAVDERNRPPVVKTITTPHTNSNEAYTIGSNASDKSPDRPDRKELDTGVLKSNHGKFVKDDSRVVDKRDKKVKEKRIFGGKSNTDGKLNKRTNEDDDAALMNARPILNEKNKAADLVVDDKTAKPLKISEKEKVNRIASKIKKLSKIKPRKNIPDETNQISAADETNNRRKSVVKNKKSVSLENNYFEGAQEMKNNSKSGDSMEHPYLSMKKKLNKCTKEIDHIVGKVTNLFQKKSSKSK